MSSLKTISVWNISNRVKVYPHLEWNGIMTYEEMLEVAKKLKTALPNYNIKIWERSSYCSEINGTWNVVISIIHDDITYTYMIRRDKELGKTFGCPFHNVDYAYDLKHTCLSLDINSGKVSSQFQEIEKNLNIIMGPGKSITCFQT